MATRCGRAAAAEEEVEEEEEDDDDDDEDEDDEVEAVARAAAGVGEVDIRSRHAGPADGSSEGWTRFLPAVAAGWALAGVEPWSSSSPVPSSNA